ncbi:DUF6452 family protein [Aureibaculum sp. 2210JD6-5]|uniref:DUF6452 family protein n=1 Tax=Aureibaculum sp. 2210JD6-5 TaxID=3103957 RepID=UPI002AACAF13|nr:DUF6452 family protein [Aureibaculum sp. 2210JD6-5]MDY7396576.1 DUF6452 family protein [Aureibaculum sp. 2210JD6-5]
MRKVKPFLLVFLTTIFVMSSCERDEICIDPITPKLIIAFYDFEDDESSKSVNNLAIEIINVDITNKSLDTVGTDSIGIPLNIYALQTTIVLTSDSKNSDLINQDTIQVNYETENIFVGRSCGYKSIFKNVSINRDFNDSERWIKSLVVEQSEIENETKAHVTILH